MRRTIALAGAGMLMLFGANAWAATPSFETPAAPLTASPPVNSVITTPQGPAFVVGNMGSMGIVSMPGTGGQGVLMNNGNGTGTLLVPNGPAETVPTSR